MEGNFFANRQRERAVPSLKICSCPTISFNVLGRNLSANGRNFSVLASNKLLDEMMPYAGAVGAILVVAMLMKKRK